ncbi:MULTISPECIES: hypothetical protein [unclassified Endozoicomonas]|uniref:hypothetical protein n=1 Tax=unclassified Endozoicomonas TaxID=2644528 RepID=UPI003BB55084
MNDIYEVQNQDTQPPTLKSIRHEGHSDLRGFTVNKHRKPPYSFDFKGARIARLEKIHHPSVRLKVDASDTKNKIVGCLVFKDLLKCRINIIPTTEFVGVSINYSAIRNRIFLAYWAGALQGATTAT